MNTSEGELYTTKMKQGNTAEMGSDYIYTTRVRFVILFWKSQWFYKNTAVNYHKVRHFSTDRTKLPCFTSVLLKHVNIKLFIHMSCITLLLSVILWKMGERSRRGDYKSSWYSPTPCNALLQSYLTPTKAWQIDLIISTVPWRNKPQGRFKHLLSGLVFFPVKCINIKSLMTPA